MALSKLSDDEQLVIFFTLCNPLHPVIAINFSSASKELWVLTQGLRHQLKADNEAAAAFARKLGLRGLNQAVCSLLRTQNFLQICSEGPVMDLVHCNETEMELLGTLGSFLPELENLSLRQVPPALPLADERFLHFAKNLCVGALPKLTNLSISNTFIGNDGAVALSSAMCRGAIPRLCRLRLASAGINDAGLSALVPALRNLNEIGELDIRGNDVSGEGIVAFASLLSEDWGRPQPGPPRFIWVRGGVSGGVQVQVRVN